MMFGFIRNLGTPELLIILVVVLLLFGAKKLPDLAKSLGTSAKEFRKGIGNDSSTSDDESTDDSTDEASVDAEGETSGESNTSETSV